MLNGMEFHWMELRFNCTVARYIQPYSNFTPYNNHPAKQVLLLIKNRNEAQCLEFSQIGDTRWCLSGFPSNSWLLVFLYSCINKKNIYIIFVLYIRRRQWHPTPVLLPGKSHGRRSLVGCSPWGREESDATERLHFHFLLSCIGEGNGNPLLPGESQGRQSLVGCRLWGRTESDMTEATWRQQQQHIIYNIKIIYTLCKGFSLTAEPKPYVDLYPQHGMWQVADTQ